eukprot:280671-Amphidinium_carterae.1
MSLSRRVCILRFVAKHPDWIPCFRHFLADEVDPSKRWQDRVWHRAAGLARLHLTAGADSIPCAALHMGHTGLARLHFMAGADSIPCAALHMEFRMLELCTGIRLNYFKTEILPIGVTEPSWSTVSGKCRTIDGVVGEA